MLKPADAFSRLTKSDRQGFDDPTEAAGPPARWYWLRTPRGTFLARSAWRSTTPEVFREYAKPA